MLLGLALLTTQSVLADIYFKVFTNIQYQNVSTKYHCNERADLDLLIGGVPASPDASFVQYEPILSTSVLCPAADEGIFKPRYEYTNFPGDVDDYISNADGTPLQTWGVRAFCELLESYGIPPYDDPIETGYYESPAQIILTCINHKALKDENKMHKEN